MKRSDDTRPLIAVSCDFDPEDSIASREGFPRGRCRVGVVYVDTILRAGGAPFIVPAFPDRSSLEPYVSVAHGFLFTGGQDYPPEWYGEREVHPTTKVMPPRRTEMDRVLMDLALSSGKPILAICGGMQLLSLVRGGALIQNLDTGLIHQDDQAVAGIYHSIAIEEGTLLSRLLGSGTCEVNSDHHQAVDPQHPGSGLHVSARAPDGTVEAVELAESDDTFVLGVQWHPERMLDADHQRRILGGLVSASLAHPRVPHE